LGAAAQKDLLDRRPRQSLRNLRATRCAARKKSPGLANARGRQRAAGCRLELRQCEGVHPALSTARRRVSGHACTRSKLLPFFGEEMERDRAGF
jgi:hypothetical protein